jgi:formyltetrahydrofolate deformylase
VQSVISAPRPVERTEVGRLLFSCSDGPGIVAAIASFLAGFGANIIHSDQHTIDPDGGQLFMRIEFHLPQLAAREDDFRAAFGAVARRFDAMWRLASAAIPKTFVIFASKSDHALLELLWRLGSGDFHADARMVISNHAVLEPLVARFGIPFHHVPKNGATRLEAERRELELIGDQADLIVLARYMQILSPAFLARYRNRIINIHHSFLPAFVGADPYAAAYERGVKLIGATAHYVTEELDAGPIIEQDIIRVTHRASIADMRRMGRLVEREVLARAVDWHLQDRVIVHENKTVVFA